MKGIRQQSSLQLPLHDHCPLRRAFEETFTVCDGGTSVMDLPITTTATAMIIYLRSCVRVIPGI